MKTKPRYRILTRMLFDDKLIWLTGQMIFKHNYSGTRFSYNTLKGYTVCNVHFFYLRSQS